MIKIVVGGQISKEEIAKMVTTLAEGKATVDIKSDLDAAMELKNGTYDYYVGACNTGGGGALAMAIALVGADLCSTVSMPGKIQSEEHIISEINKGKKAFGFTAQHAETVLPILVKQFLIQKGVNE